MSKAFVCLANDFVCIALLNKFSSDTNGKALHCVQGFVTPSGFKPETF
jgi:hypothetical protein